MSMLYEKMIKLKMDGIVFYPIFSNPNDIDCQILCSFTLKEFDNIDYYPKSNYAFYKRDLSTMRIMYYDGDGEIIK